MVEIYHEDHADMPMPVRDVFDRLSSEEDGCRYAVVRIPPGDEGGETLANWHHDLRGALRSFRFLADKMAAQYDEGDERGKKTVDAIRRHLKVMEEFKAKLFDRLFPSEES